MRTSKFVVLALVLLGVIAGVLVWQLGPPRELTYPRRSPDSIAYSNASPGLRALSPGQGWLLWSPWPPAR